MSIDNVICAAAAANQEGDVQVDAKALIVTDHTDPEHGGYRYMALRGDITSSDGSTGLTISKYGLERLYLEGLDMVYGT